MTAPGIEERAYPHAELPRELEIQIWDFVRLVWSDAIRGDARFRDRMFDVPAAMHFVRAAGSLLVSHVQVLSLRFDTDGRELRLGGVGGVMTYPQFRGEGHASALMRRAAEHVARTSSVGMLFCDEDRVGFYDALGWARLKPERVSVHGEEPADVVMTIGDAATLPDVLSLDWTW